MKGYADGSFKPEQLISFVEAAKIINTVREPYAYEHDELWYKNYVHYITYKAAIPSSINALDQQITRGEMAEMIYRLRAERTDKSAHFYDFFDKKFKEQVYQVKSGRFSIQNNEVLCSGAVVQGADQGTFEILSLSYAKDKNRAYFCGGLSNYQAIQGVIEADVKSFQVLSELFAKDAKSVFRSYVKIDSADAATFQLIEENSLYAKDKNYVYHLSEILEGAKQAGFRIIGMDYATDGKLVFFGAYKIDGADAGSFQLLAASPYAHDVNNVYLRGVTLKGVESASFEIIGKFYLKDAYKVYYETYDVNNKEGIPPLSGLEDVPGADPATFEIIWNKDYYWLYGRDANGVYLNNGKIEGADPASFEVLSDNKYSRDQNFVYFFGHKIPDADPKSFELLNWIYAKDVDTVFYIDEKLEGADPATFVAAISYKSLGDNYDAYDKNHTYQEGKVVD